MSVDLLPDELLLHIVRMAWFPRCTTRDIARNAEHVLAFCGRQKLQQLWHMSGCKIGMCHMNSFTMRLRQMIQYVLDRAWSRVDEIMPHEGFLILLRQSTEHIGIDADSGDHIAYLAMSRDDAHDYGLPDHYLQTPMQVAAHRCMLARIAVQLHSTYVPYDAQDFVSIGGKVYVVELSTHLAVAYADISGSLPMQPAVHNQSQREHNCM